MFLKSVNLKLALLAACKHSGKIMQKLHKHIFQHRNVYFSQSATVHPTIPTESVK